MTILHGFEIPSDWELIMDFLEFDGNVDDTLVLDNYYVDKDGQVWNIWKSAVDSVVVVPAIPSFTMDRFVELYGPEMIEWQALKNQQAAPSIDPSPSPPDQK